MNYLVSVVLVGVLWGITDILRKITSSHGDSKTLTILFNLGATLVPLVWLLLDKQRKIGASTSAVLLSLIGGGIGGIGGVILYNSLAKNPASITFGLVRTIILLTVFVGSVVFLSDKITLKAGAGFVLSLLGVYLLASR